MLYPVRILDSRGNIREVVSSRQLNKLHWKKFDLMVSGEFAIGQKEAAEKTNTRNHEYDNETLGPDPG